MLVSVPEPMISRLQGVDSDVEGYPTIRLLVGGKKEKITTVNERLKI